MPKSFGGERPEALLALPAEVAESRGLKGKTHETGRLPGLDGRRAVTIRRQIEGLLCCPALTSALRQANGRVNRAGSARGPGFSLHARLHFFAPCIPDTKRLATSGDVCASFSATLAQCLPLRTTVSISTPAHSLLCLLFCACTVLQRFLLFAVSNAVALGLMHTVSHTHVSRSRALSPSLSLTLSLTSLSWPLMYTHTHAHTHTQMFPLTHA